PHRLGPVRTVGIDRDCDRVGPDRERRAGPGELEPPQLAAPERLSERTPRFADPPPHPHGAEDRNNRCVFEDPWEDSSPKDRLEGERAQKARQSPTKGGTMSDDSKIERVAANDEPADEVEAHAKLDAKLDSKVDRPGMNDEGDEVEAHVKLNAPKLD